MSHLALWISTCSVCAVAHGQTLMHDLPSPGAGDHFGTAVTFLADLNGDRRDDFAVSAPRSGPGYVQVHSGEDAALLYRWSGAASLYRFGHIVRNVGDINADGVEDVGVGIPGDIYLTPTATGQVRIYSGANGAILWTWNGSYAREQFGSYVDRAGDVDNDGTLDVIIGAPGDGSRANGGLFYIYSGRTGQVLVSELSPAPSALFGYIANADVDFDADGRRDYAVSAPWSGSPPWPGSVVVYSGANPRIQLRSFGSRSGGNAGFGSAVLGLSDVTGDGIDDLAIGCPEDASLGGTGYVDVYKGGSGALHFTKRGDAGGDLFGSSLAVAGDLDADGVNDLLVAAPQTYSTRVGYVRLFSGRTGATISTFRFPEGNGLGLALSGTGFGDVDGNGEVDFLLGLPGAAGPAGARAGRVRIYRWFPSGALALPPTLSFSIGGIQSIALNAGNAHAGSPYLVLGTASGTAPGFALGALGVPLNPDAYTSFTLLTPNTPLLASSRGTFDAVGQAQAQFTLPRAVPGLIGLRLDHAALYATAGALFCTNAAPLLITP